MTWTAGPVTLGGITMTVIGQYDTTVNWNGYLCPWLDAHGVEQVLGALRDAYAAAEDPYCPVWVWHDGALVLTEVSDGGEARNTTRLEPDKDGLYALGAYGWVWTVHDEMRADILLRIEQAKREVRADVAAGTVPTTVDAFYQLHDYVDANEYGGLCDGTLTGDDLCAVGNIVQDAVHVWLARGGHR